MKEIDVESTTGRLTNGLLASWVGIGHLMEAKLMKRGEADGLDSCNTGGVPSVLPASWEGIGYLMEEDWIHGRERRKK
ncbi:hypothetical protein EVAR_13180_1 [Eumeta japonica]|uniref:Uncharacterized protein n=1 Tax=Eumeta variegata TaxID=151549 RepID=A0A4C1TS26_EUMVA|nr:hypothetical protein EVAR_13180_1 [Eumeta japonica]